MDVVAWAAWAWILGVVGLGVALFLLLRMRPMAPPPAEAAGRMHSSIVAAVLSFLRREYLVLAAFVILAAALLGLATTLRTAAAFLTGAVSAALAGLLGAAAATPASSRAAAADRPGGSLAEALRGGGVAGLALASLALLAIGGWYAALGAGAITDADFIEFGRVTVGLAFGASSVALFSRVAGGIYTAANRLGAGIVAGEDAELGEADGRSPATVGASAGSVVGDVAGTGSDLFESLVGSTIASMVIGAAAQLYATSRGAAVALPVLTAATGLLTSLLAMGAARALGRARPAAAMRNLVLAATVLFLVLEYLVVRALGFEIVDPTGARVFRPDAPFLAILAGSIAGLLIAFVRAWDTAGRPARRAAARTAGPAALAGGLSLALEASVLPAVLVVIALWISYFAAGIYGIGIAAIGMLGTVGLTASVLACGAIASTGAALARSGEATPEGAASADELVTAGGVVVAVGRGFAAAVAGLAALTVMVAYVSATGSEELGLDLLDSAMLVGLALGTLVPFIAAGLATHGAASAGARVAAEARRQLREVKGLMHGRGTPDSDRCTAISTRAALIWTAGPAALAVAVPLLAALVDMELLTGVLTGATLSGLLLALFLSHGGTLPDRVAADVESGATGQSAASLRGAMRQIRTLFGDAGAPAVNTVVKVMATLSLALSPWIARLHGGSILRDETLREGARQLLALLGR